MQQYADGVYRQGVTALRTARIEVDQASKKQAGRSTSWPLPWQPSWALTTTINHESRANASTEPLPLPEGCSHQLDISAPWSASHGLYAVESSHSLVVEGKGNGMAFGVIDYGPEQHLLWVTAIDATGEIW
jgi:hypothetical protein